MNKRFSILALVLAFFVLCSAFVACSTDPNDTPDKPKSVPIYQGMTVSAVDNSSRVASASFSFAKNRLSSPVRGNPTDRGPGWWDGDKYGRGDDFDPDKPFGDGATTIEDAASGTLEVVGGGETMYYAEADSDVIVTVKLRNPDAFEILSFTLNGKKYTGYMFERGSDTENIILKVNVGNVSGVVDYTIDAIKYVDGTEIKDVLMEGDKTVRVGVRSDDAVTCKVTNEKVTRNSVSFDVRVADLRSLVSSSGGYVKAVLYDGDQIRTSDIYVNATTHVVFYNLAPNTVYQYGVFGCYDDFGGEGVRLNQLYKQSVVTSATVLFGDADVQAQSLSWSYVWGDTPATERAFTSLTLWQGEQKVRDLDVAATTVDGLYTNCAYTLVAEYLVDGSTESIRLQFVTLAKQVPSVSLSDVVASQTGVRFVVNATDPDGVGTVTKVEVHSGTSWHITLATDASVCDNLLSDTGYTINVEYTYDLGDGNGKQTTYASEDFATLAKATPTVEIAKAVADDVSVGFAVNATDPDGVGAVSRIELLRDGDSPIVVDDVNARTIGGLLSDATYTLKVTYTYDLNNGKGAQNIVATSQFETTAKNAPTVELVDVVAGQSDVTFGVETVDKDNVGRISAVELLRENAVVATMDGNARKFTNLLSDTRYTLRVTYSYNLNDGKGERAVCATQNFATQAKYVPQVNIAKVVATTNSVTFVVNVYDRDNVGSLSRIELLHGDGQPIVANANVRSFEGLLSDNVYTLNAVYAYDLNDGLGVRTLQATSQFATTAVTAPTVNIAKVNPSKTSVTFVVDSDDPYGVLTLEQILLTHGNDDIIAADSTSARSFQNLLSDNLYTIKVVYSFDLNDGTGKQTLFVTSTFATLAKQTPSFKISDLSAGKRDVAYNLIITDIDGVGAVTLSEVLLGGSKFADSTDSATRQFGNLLSNNVYALHVVYGYDLNDGLGMRQTEQTTTFTTLAMTEPSVSANNVYATKSGVTFDVDTTDVDNVGAISAVELLHGDDQPIVAANVNLRTFDGLMSANNYVLRVTYTYDLCDGVGARTKTSSVQFTTLPKTTPSLYVSNVSATKDGASFGVVVTDVDEVGAVQAILFERDGESIALDDVALRTVGGLLSDNEYVLRVVYLYDLCDGVGEQTTEATYTFTTLAKQLPQVSIGNFVVTRNSLRADIGSTDVDGVGAVSAVRLYNGDKLVATADVAQRVLFDNLTADTNYTIAVDYTFDLNDGQGTQTLTQRVDYYTAPIFDFVRSGCANTSAVSVGEVIYFEAIVDNPSGVVVSKVKINGNYYDVAPATTANSVIVDITVDDSFEGGNTDLTMTEIVGTLHGQEMTLDVQTMENTATVFVNGELTVKSITIVDEDGNECDYVVNGQTYYYLVEFNNKTGYNIDAVTIERNTYWVYNDAYFGPTATRFGKEELVVIDAECVKIAFAVDDWASDITDGRNLSYVTKVEYSNELLGDKQKDAGRICSPLFANGVSGDVVEIKTASDLHNMSISAHYVLANDIDLSGTEWKPSTFNGLFDGQGHTISGMNFVGTVENGDFYWGLFSQANGIVRNLNLQGRLIATITSTTDTKYTAYVGGLCGITRHLTVENVKNSVDLTVIDGGALYVSYVGGLLGYAGDKVTIVNAVNYAMINGTCCGGLVGQAYGLTAINCENYGSVIGIENCGGIVGDVGGVTDIANCVNYGNVSGLRRCGGLVGTANSKGRILKSNNYGNVMAKEYYAGGIAGSSSIPIYQCCNVGDIQGLNYIGGIAGDANIISQCLNIGEVVGKICVGGVAGLSYGNVYNSGNLGNVLSNDQQVGGIAGSAANTGVTFENSFNGGKIQGANYGGGIIGYYYDDVSIRNCYSNGNVECKDGVFNALVPYNGYEITVDGGYYTQGYDKFGTQKTLPEIIEIMRELWDNEIWDFDNLDQYGNPTLRGLPSTNE